MCVPGLGADRCCVLLQAFTPHTLCMGLLTYVALAEGIQEVLDLNRSNSKRKDRKEGQGGFMLISISNFLSHPSSSSLRSCVAQWTNSCDRSGPVDDRTYFLAFVFPYWSHKATHNAVYKESWRKSEKLKYSCRECLWSSIASNFFFLQFS